VAVLSYGTRTGTPKGDLLPCPTAVRSRASESQRQREDQSDHKQGVEAEMEKVGAGIVAAGGENLARACVHSGVVAL
jgi:hypothetical protein